jgi:Na+/proline symporter
MYRWKALVVGLFVLLSVFLVIYAVQHRVPGGEQTQMAHNAKVPEKSEAAGALGALALFGSVLVLYFIPTILANYNHHRSVGGIAVINFFLGWTFLGWVIALAWAANGNVEAREVGHSKT